MKPIVEIKPLETSDFETVSELFMQQSSRQHGLDERLRRFSLDEVHAYLDKMKKDQRDLLMIKDEAGRAQAVALLYVFEYPDDSSMLALFPQHCGVAGMMSLPAPTDPHAAAIADAMVPAAEEYWQSKGATGGILAWPSADPWLQPLLNQQGYVTYSTLAVRPGNDLPDHPHPPPKGLTIRPAQPADEAMVAKLIVDQIAFHVGITPFDRVVPGTEIGARERMARVWSGDDPRDGASIFLVAEMDGQIAGMIEFGLSDFRDKWSYLAPDYYGYISIAMVAEAFRGQGIGHYLLAAALNDLKRYGVGRFSLHYVPDNPLSSPFWQSKGYRPLMITYQKRYTKDA